MMDEDARRIAQDFLDRQGDATIAGDVDATLEWCDIPCTLKSIQGSVVATTTAEMRAICQTFIDKLKMKGLTHMVRNCLEAEFRDENTIWATYHTRYVGQGNLLTGDPYNAHIILRRTGDRWKISAMQFDATNDSPANETLRHWLPEGRDDA